MKTFVFQHVYMLGGGTYSYAGAVPPESPAQGESSQVGRLQMNIGACDCGPPPSKAWMVGDALARRSSQIQPLEVIPQRRV